MSKLYFSIMKNLKTPDIHIERNNKKILPKIILIIFGSLAVILGLIGMFLPLLPTTPFLLLAAICFAKSSKRLHKALLNNRWCGEYIRNYQEKKGITLKHKVYTLLLLWLSIGYTAIFIISTFWTKLLLFAIAVGVTFHIVMLKTCKITKETVGKKFNINEIEKISK